MNTESSYDKMINQFGYRGLDNPKLYFNEDYKGFVQNHRGSLNSLAEALLDEGDTIRAKKVLLFNLEKINDVAVRYDITAASTIELLFKVGEKQKALEVANTVGGRAEEMANYQINRYSTISLEVRRALYVLGELQRILYESGENDLAKKYEDAYQKILERLQVTEGADQRQF